MPVIQKARTPGIASTVFAAMVIALAASMFSAPAQAAPKCQPWFNSGEGKMSKTVWGAKFSARAGWRKKIRSLYGLRWMYWHKARERHYYCEKRDGGKHHCIAYAKACRL